MVHSHPNNPETKRAASANDGKVKSWREHRSAAQGLHKLSNEFKAAFEKVHYDISTGVFFFLVGFQYFLAKKGYSSWADIFLGTEATRFQIAFMTIVMAFGVAVLSAIVAELLAPSLSKSIYRWRVKQLAEEIGSNELAEEQVAITVRSQRKWGIAAGVAVFLLAVVGLGTRAAISAENMGEASERFDPNMFLQSTGADSTKIITPAAESGLTSDELAKGMSIWSIFFFLVALLAEFGSGIYLWTYLRFYISVIRPLSRAEREQERLFQEITMADQRIDNLLREAFPDAALEQIAAQLGNVVAATAERVRFRYPHDPEAYLGASSRFIGELKSSISSNGHSQDPTKEAHVTVETSYEA